MVFSLFTLLHRPARAKRLLFIKRFLLAGAFLQALGLFVLAGLFKRGFLSRHTLTLLGG